MAGMEQIAGMALQQTMSPQMQQSLNILQAPLTELRQLVDIELRENPALEEVLPENPAEERAQKSDLEDQWSDYYAQRATAEPWTKEALEKRQHFFDSQTRPQTLQEHLLEQLLTASWTKPEARIAVEIIGNLDEQGYFRTDLEDVAYAAGSDALEVERVLEKVQEFDPPGIAARNLGECLFLQLKRQGRQYSNEARIVRHHLEELGRKKLTEIANALDIPVQEVQHAAAAITKLDPRPGRAFLSEPEQIVIPEIIVERDGDDYLVRLSNEEIPVLRISDSYKDMLPDSSREVRDYLREKIKGGKFFIRSIQQRQQTLMNIGREIVTRQREFLDHGPSHLRPMTMSQVADAVGVHETTVSRAASGKYIATPQGIFEIKYFFTHGYTNSDGEAVSNESVRQAILALVREESPRHPHSDQDMVQLLNEQGLAVARRTVAKYREQLGILPSHLRKSF
ncbi:MAG: RNA polymerase factor sigma-54 [Verrucomicrobia bacterium]|nr:RNA polymerase factor sigma-54 [Verrucomicrobiota bacterium]